MASSKKKTDGPADMPPASGLPPLPADGTATTVTLEESATVAAASAAAGTPEAGIILPPKGDETELPPLPADLTNIERYKEHAKYCGDCSAVKPCRDGFVLAGYKPEDYAKHFGVAGLSIPGLNSGDAPLEIDGDGSPPFTQQLPPAQLGHLVRCTVVGSNIKTEHRLYQEGEVDVFSLYDVATSGGHLVPVNESLTPED